MTKDYDPLFDQNRSKIEELEKRINKMSKMLGHLLTAVNNQQEVIKDLLSEEENKNKKVKNRNKKET